MKVDFNDCVIEKYAVSRALKGFCMGRVLEYKVLFWH